MTMQGRRGKSPVAIDSMNDGYCRSAAQFDAVTASANRLFYEW
jgi:hypothetical protein